MEAVVFSFAYRADHLQSVWYSARPAAKYLLSSGRRRHWPQKSEEELEEMVESLFMKCDVDELADLADTQNPKDMTAMRAALPYVEQWRLAKWATQVNVQQGVAPSTESVLQQYEAQRQQLPEAVRPRAVGVPAQNSARVWAHAWRVGSMVASEFGSKFLWKNCGARLWQNRTTSSRKIGPGTPNCGPISGTQSVPVLGTEFVLNSGMRPRSPLAGAVLVAPGFPSSTPDLGTDSVPKTGTLFGKLSKFLNNFFVFSAGLRSLAVVELSWYSAARWQGGLEDQLRRDCHLFVPGRRQRYSFCIEEMFCRSDSECPSPQTTMLPHARRAYLRQDRHSTALATSDYRK